MAGGAAADDGAEDDGAGAAAGEDHGVVGAGAAAGGVLGAVGAGAGEVPMICRRTCESTIEGMLKQSTSAS